MIMIRTKELNTARQVNLLHLAEPKKARERTGGGGTWLCCCDIEVAYGSWLQASLHVTARFQPDTFLSSLLPLCNEASKETTQELKWWTRTKYSKPGNPFPKFSKKNSLWRAQGVEEEKSQLCVLSNQQCHLTTQLRGLWLHSSSSPCGYVEDRYAAACLECCLLGRGHPTSGSSEGLTPTQLRISWGAGAPIKRLWSVFCLGVSV